MARLRRKSSVLDAARQRLAGLRSIDPAPNFGSGLTVAGYQTAITSFSSDLDAYNEKLAALDDQKNSLEAAEANLRDMNRRFLAAAEAEFGPDSSEFEQVGGTRRSEIKRSKKKGSSGTPTS
jgi:hypothetical protein